MQSMEFVNEGIGYIAVGNLSVIDIPYHVHRIDILINIAN